MTTDQIVIFSLLGLVIALLIWGRWRYDFVTFAALILAVAIGAVPPEEAFSGFAHPATIIIALVLIMSRGLSNAGVVDALSRHLIDTRRSLSSHIAIMAGLGAGLSAVMNNVAALALLMPVDLQAAEKAKRAPGLTLMPLSFATMLGGLITLIGTPPNIIIASFRERALGSPFEMFDFAPVGLACAIIGTAFIALFGWRLIPVAQSGRSRAQTGFSLDEYVAELLVPEGSDVVGKRVRDLDDTAEKTETAILGLFRRHERLPGLARWQIIEAADTLVVEGSPKQIAELAEALGLTFVSTREDRKLLKSSDLGFLEVVVPEGARIIGRSAYSMRLLSRHGIALLGVLRQGKQLPERIRRLKILPGDILLLYGPSQRLPVVADWMGCLTLAGGSTRAVQHDRALLAGVLFAGAVALATAELLPLSIALAGTCLAFVAFGILPAREVYDSVEWPVVVLVGSLIPLGAALETSGGTALIAEQIVGLSSGLSPAMVLVVLMAVTMVLSDALNNSATAVIAAPVALDVAGKLGVSPDPFLMGVAVAASCSFLTPIGHKNNTLIMGPGGYRFSDYWPLGLPLEVLVLAVAAPVILLVWPL
jgi:di/tricarboxylate transporter